MAEDGRPPPPDQQSGELPRRVPGTGGLTPAQVRRGFLPPATSLPGDPEAEPTTPDVEVRSDDAPAPGLPRRVPGTSAIQPPPSPDRPHSPDESDAAAAGSAVRVPASPEQVAASAARLVRPKIRIPKAQAQGQDAATSAQTAQAVASASAPTAAEPLAAVPASTSASAPTSAPASARPSARRRQNAKRTSPPGSAPQPGRVIRRRSSGRARRWQLVGLLVVIAAVLAAILAIALAHRHPAAPPGSEGPVPGHQLIAG
jgi:hypothetical protein